MGLFKKIIIIVILLLVAGGVYLYNVLSLPNLPDASAAVADLADGPTGKVFIKSKSPYNMTVLLSDLAAAPDIALVGEITLPEGASADNPVPAMVIIHGSGGIAEGREREYATLLARNGIASLVLDYYSSRGITPDTGYMKKVMAVTEVDLIVDAFASLKALGTHPAIDAERIGVMGFSYGGMATRYALNRQMKDLLAPDVPAFAAHVDFYGPCHQTLMTDETTGAPFLSLRGREDASNDIEACASAEAVLVDMGSAVQTHIYDTAGHAWEVTRARKLYEEAPYIAGCNFGFTPEGIPTINDAANDADEPALDASRNMRAFKRISIQFSAKECIKYGYIMGQDTETRDDAYARMLKFLEETFRM